MGILVVSALVVFFADTVRRALLEGPQIVVTTPKARGLIPGAEVWVAGARAGRVISISFGDPSRTSSERVIVNAVLFHEMADLLRADATVRISPAALLAPPVLHIAPGTDGSGPFVFGDTMTVLPKLDTEEFMALADSAYVAIGLLAGLSERLQVQLRAGDGTLGRFHRDPVHMARVRERFDVLAQIAAEVSETGSIPRLVRDDSLRAALARTGANLRTFSEAAPATVDALDRLAVDVDALTARLDAIRSNLDRGFGTVGRGMNDGEIAEQVDKLQSARDSAIMELTRNPFRWLRFRVF